MRESHNISRITAESSPARSDKETGQFPVTEEKFVEEAFAIYRSLYYDNPPRLLPEKDAGAGKQPIELPQGVNDAAYKTLKFILSPFVRHTWIENVEGIENIPPDGRVVIASNHASYFDFLCFAAACPRPVNYLAGEIFFKQWWWRPMVTLTGQIMVDRNASNKNGTLTKALAALKEERAVGIFPEGTRSKDGRLQRAYTGVAQLALQARAPVVPVAMIGTYNIMSRHDKFPNFNAKCRIRIGKPIDLSFFYGHERNRETLRYLTDAIIMRRIGELMKRR